MTWYIGWGEAIDESKLIEPGPGSVYTEPAGAPRFVAAPAGEAIVQVTGAGPTTIYYVNPAHDRRGRSSRVTTGRPEVRQRHRLARLNASRSMPAEVSGVIPEDRLP